MSIFSNHALTGEHALVTGATGGIGYETALLLASMGADVTITGRRQAALETLKKDIIQQNPHAQVFTFSADIGKEEDRRQLVERAHEQHGFISLLVNSAGVVGGNVVEKLTQSEMERIMHINYTATVLLTQLVYENMRKHRKGAIVNVSSLSGLRGTRGNTAYAASKFALIGFTHSMAVEAVSHGIRVNAVCPGYVETEMGKQAIQNKAERENRSFEDQLKIAKNSIPSGRLTEPKEVAHTIAYLLSEAGANIVGESIKISGGSVLR
ncbi:3-oxoacyl-[acyl-carrier protein] reductase [Alteribacillus persepolensis]|uniref:3-oxoacyl-[acyl-carrier protein] reductase n=1 Tax=Alteribacillus persepolensis TaxID=568899 RepID=A0A1G8GFM6_9BACI|nr:SDR family oxidoreductase [Alteribacillus persepolensis]SDH93168.1 3-oxoacyl-[acyl-carrier protein] reductase [Alteribacillus persepolensis]